MPYGTIWHYMTSHCIISCHMMSFDIIWHHVHLVCTANVVGVGSIWNLYVTSGYIIWRHLTSYDVMWRHPTCHIIWRHLTSCDVIWHHVTSPEVTKCHVTSCDVNWRHKMSYEVTCYVLAPNGISQVTYTTLKLRYLKSYDLWPLTLVQIFLSACSYQICVSRFSRENTNIWTDRTEGRTNPITPTAEVGGKNYSNH